MIYDCRFILNSKIPFIVFNQVCFLRCAWILHNKLYTIITLKSLWTLLVTADHGYLMFSIAYNVVCVPNYSVPPYSLTLTYLEWVGLIPQLEMIFMYCVKCQRWAEYWFIFFSFQLDICIPVKMDQKCKNNPDKFCYICSNVVLPNCHAKIIDFVKKAYCNYFGVKLKDQDKLFTPCICYKTCVENLRDWKNGKKKSMPFAILMVWREGKDSITDCNFCMINLKGINHKNKHHIQYPNVHSAIRPIPHGPDLPVPEPGGNMEYSSDSEHRDVTVIAGDDAYKPEEDN